MIKRFYKDKRYIGINYTSCDTMRVWRDELTVHAFYGRPNRGYDAIEEYTPSLWGNLLAKAQKQAEASFRAVHSTDDVIFLIPTWIHGNK